MADKEEIIQRILDIKGDRIDFAEMRFRPLPAEKELELAALEKELDEIEEADFQNWKDAIAEAQSESILHIDEDLKTA